MTDDWGCHLCCSTAYSIYTFIKFKPGINRKFGIRDPYGIHNLHGLPGLIAAFAGAIAAALATETNYNYR